MGLRIAGIQHRPLVASKGEGRTSIHIDRSRRSFDAEWERLYGVSYRMLGSSSEAEDAVQETGSGYARSTPRLSPGDRAASSDAKRRLAAIMRLREPSGSFRSLTVSTNFWRQVGSMKTLDQAGGMSKCSTSSRSPRLS